MFRRGVVRLLGALALVLVACGGEVADSGEVESSPVVTASDRMGDLLPATHDIEVGDKPVVLWFWAPG